MTAELAGKPMQYKVRLKKTDEEYAVWCLGSA